MNEHERAARDMEGELETMARESARVGEHIDEVRSDWHRKQADDAVPGATSPIVPVDEGDRQVDPDKASEEQPG